MMGILHFPSTAYRFQESEPAPEERETISKPNFIRVIQNYFTHYQGFWFALRDDAIHQPFFGAIFFRDQTNDIKYL